jgi:hypothetical protein
MINELAAYGVGHQIRIVSNGTAFYAWYNKVYIGTTTIDDAPLQTSTKHGMFFVDLDSTVDNLCVFPRGTGGEYSGLSQVRGTS